VRNVYLLGLKGNQGNLHKDVQLYFQDPPENIKIVAHEEADKDHGRLEIRRCEAIYDTQWLQNEHKWPGLQTISKITSTRIIGAKTTTDIRFYISSDAPSAAKILSNTRSHWAIENSLHYVLDMSFGEDACRIRKDNAPLAVATIRHVALNLLQAAKIKRESIKKLRKKAGWDNQTLKRILNINS
jgi:predicted transposase YbfD/YdcC